MSEVLYWDKETRSDIDLGKAGVHVYAESPNTANTMAAGAFDDADIFGFLIDPYTTEPQCDDATWGRVYDHVASGKRVVAHNASFELRLWAMNRDRRPDIWPELTAEQTFCTMAQCHALSLPGKLEKAAEALRLPYQKDMVGHAIMKKLCKPRKPRKGEPKDVLLWHEDPADILRELEYCKADVAPEREIYKRVLPLSERERQYWLIDYRINDRGLGIDLANAIVCETAATREQGKLAAELHGLTGESVKTPNSHKDFRGWLAANGCPLPDLRRSTIDKAIERADTLHPNVVRALEIRQAAAKSSTSKLKAMRVGTCKDGRARGLLQYHTAGTGRPGGKRIPPTNMPRTPEEFEVEHAEDIFGWLAVSGGERVVAAQYGTVLDGVSWSLRALIKAAPGCRLLAADYSNIEGRVLAWLAGEEWKLEAFRQYDAGTGPDLYKLGYSKSFGVPVDQVTKEQRQNVGKVNELLAQYGGAHGAILNMFKAGGRKYRWNGKLLGSAGSIETLTTAVRAAVPADVWDDAAQLYWRGAQESAEEILEARRVEAEMNRELFGDEPDPFEPDFFDVMKECAKQNRHGLAVDPWAAIRVSVDSWRQGNPAICAFWKALEKAAKDAVSQPGVVTNAGRISYFCDGDFLMCRLPSGRRIAYPYPRVKWEVKTYKRPDGSEYDRRISKLFYEGFDVKHRWGLQYAYGGSLANNCLSGDTEVFSSRGWIALRDVSAADKLWDGRAWVRHGGLIAKGEQRTIQAAGVRMTPDHLVLTSAGWKDASSCERFDRADVRLPHSLALRRLGWKEIALARYVQMRHRKDFNCERVDANRKARRSSVMRLSSPCAAIGSTIAPRADARQRASERQLRKEQLPLDNSESAGAKQTSESTVRDTVGASDRRGSIRAQRNRCNDAALSAKSRMLACESFDTASRYEQVFDILACGPRNRFVVRGTVGPVIVHNCTQGTARCVQSDSQHRLEAAGYPIVLHVYDENVCELPYGQGSLDELCAIMRALEPWADGLPVAVSGFEGERYRK